MLYFCLASLLSKKMGMHGKNRPRQQHIQPLLSRALALRQIKQGWQRVPQQPIQILIFRWGGVCYVKSRRTSCWCWFLKVMVP